MKARTPFAARGRTPSSPAQVRKGWRDWLAAVRASGEAALAGAPYDKFAEMAVTRGVFLVGKGPFPFEDVARRGMFEAFTATAATFAGTTVAARRAWQAPVLLAFAGALEDALDEEGLALAAESRRRIGDVD